MFLFLTLYNVFSGEYGGLRSSSSEGYLDKAWIQNQGGPGEDGLNSTTLQQQIDQLSQAVSSKR